MTHDTRLLLYALGAVVLLIALIARVKLHPLIALTVVSLGMGAAAGMPLAAAAKAF
jgi:gluconate:H+ symporter, GntP family